MMTVASLCLYVTAAAQKCGTLKTWMQYADTALIKLTVKFKIMLICNSDETVTS